MEDLTKDFKTAADFSSCEECGKPFKFRKSKRYCSNKCRAIAANKRSATETDIKLSNASDHKKTPVHLTGSSIPSDNFLSYMNAEIQHWRNKYEEAVNALNEQANKGPGLAGVLQKASENPVVQNLLSMCAEKLFAARANAPLEGKQSDPELDELMEIFQSYSTEDKKHLLKKFKENKILPPGSRNPTMPMHGSANS